MAIGAIGLGLSIAKGAIGLGQTLFGATKKNKRPTARVPQAAKDAVTRNRSAVGRTRRDGREVVNDEIRQNTTNAIANVKQATNNQATILNATANAQAQENKAMRQQDIIDNRDQQRDEFNLQRSLQNLSGWQDRVADYNERQKFAENANMKAGLVSGGLSNMMTAASDIVGLKTMSDMGLTGGEDAVPDMSAQGKYLQEIQKLTSLGPEAFNRDTGLWRDPSTLPKV